MPNEYNHYKIGNKSGHRPNEAKLSEQTKQEFKINIINILKEIKENISYMKQIKNCEKNQMEILNFTESRNREQTPIQHKIRTG